MGFYPSRAFQNPASISCKEIHRPTSLRYQIDKDYAISKCAFKFDLLIFVSYMLIFFDVERLLIYNLRNSRV